MDSPLADNGITFVTEQQISPDQELIENCRRGRQDAWQQILNRYERLVFSIPLNYGLTRADAADVAQLTFRSGRRRRHQSLPPEHAWQRCNHLLGASELAESGAGFAGPTLPGIVAPALFL